MAARPLAVTFSVPLIIVIVVVAIVLLWIIF
jgi:hypothetical protein